MHRQGERILIGHLAKASQYLEQVILVPFGQESLALDASLAGFLLLEKIQGDMAQDSKILWPMVLANSTAIFIKGNIENPV